MKYVNYLILSLLLLSATACHKEEPDEGPHYPVYRPEVAVVDGAFSVSSSIRVEFAAGNVQYMPFFGYWRIADSQYRVMGKSNERDGRRYSGWYDLFGWGTGNSPRLRTIDTSDFVEFVDWGVNFGAGWRTLGEEEWEYLLFSRQGAGNLRTTAVVCGVKGLFLFPDDWECPGGITLSYGNYDFGNEINDRQMVRLQESGAVFLPSAGYRQGSRYVKGSLCYWTSTSVGVRGFEGMRVFLDLTAEDSFVGLKGMSSYCGLAVRLVRNIK